MDSVTDISPDTSDTSSNASYVVPADLMAVLKRMLEQMPLGQVAHIYNALLACETKKD